MTRKIIVSALAIGGICAMSTGAYAGSSDDVMARLAALEKENAAIRKENAALRENKTLRERNATLKSSVSVPAPVATAPAAKPNAFDAYAADLPMAYKARPVEAVGQFRVWGEGGAVFTDGTRTTRSYTPSTFFSGVPGGSGSGPSILDLTPKTGWEAAAGFDYRFAASPWHVSGQFRYGESRGNADVSSSANIDAATIALLGGGGNVTSANSSEALSYRNRETHWLADLAIGRDVLGSGPSTMQVKGGIRIAGYTSDITSRDDSSFLIASGRPINIDGISTTEYGVDTRDTLRNKASFVGAGPRIGVEGAIPFAGAWSFDYLGDVAVLFGTQRLETTSTTAIISATPPQLALLAGGGSSSFSTSEHFATVLNADLQAGVSYWVKPNVKVSASYRLDAYLSVLRIGYDPAPKQTYDRLIHGPRVGVSATF